MISEADNIQMLINICHGLLKRIEILEEQVRDLQLHLPEPYGDE